ncbi:hypothetical protein T484DRAFT_1937048 [Baffinella frigidus]|nr:hypothetical protein T484DRAFT_1937048 [Cryptophyta sp. CCMP2293]
MWDVDDSEIDAYIRTDEEAASRETIWNSMNREYLDHQEERMRMQEMRGETAPTERKRRRRNNDDGVPTTSRLACAHLDGRGCRVC